jgi:uncharacterized protein with HEPN domain
MLPEGDSIRLRHIVDAATEAVAAAQTRERKDLTADRSLMHTVVRCVEIVGEAAANVSQPTRQQLPQIPWRKIVAMRNQLATGITQSIWILFGRPLRMNCLD